MNADRRVKVMLFHAQLHSHSEPTNNLVSTWPEVVNANHSFLLLLVNYYLHVGNLGVVFIDSILKGCSFSMINLYVILPIKPLGLFF